MSDLSFLIPNETSMLQLGAHLAKQFKAGDVVYLRGGLGAGKTTLARGIIQALGYSDPITSPTYSIIQSYDTTPSVHHLDLYRLHGDDDYQESGLSDTDTTHSIWLIEWPDQALASLPKPTLELQLKLSQAEHTLSISAADNNIFCVSTVLGVDSQMRGS